MVIEEDSGERTVVVRIPWKDGLRWVDVDRKDLMCVVECCKSLVHVVKYAHN